MNDTPDFFLDGNRPARTASRSASPAADIARCCFTPARSGASTSSGCCGRSASSRRSPGGRSRRARSRSPGKICNGMRAAARRNLKEKFIAPILQPSGRRDRLRVDRRRPAAVGSSLPASREILREEYRRRGDDAAGLAWGHRICFQHDELHDRPRLEFFAFARRRLPGGDGSRRRSSCFRKLSRLRRLFRRFSRPRRSISLVIR